MELYDSQYLLILAPSLLIALLFLFFWLFMREPSYDEVLARHKRDLKLPPAKPDARKKAGGKKKGKKKEGGGPGGGAGGAGEGESDSDPRDLDLTDAVASSEEELPAQPAPSDAPSGLRERKRKEKKQQAAPAHPAGGPAPLEEPSPVHEVNGSKPTPHKNKSPIPVAKQPSPPPADKKGSQKKAGSEADELQLETKVEQDPTPIKKEAPVTMETKTQDSPSTPPTHTPTTSGGKKKSSSKKQKVEPALVDEAPIKASVYVPLKDGDSAAPADTLQDSTPSKINAKRPKNEADKESAEGRLGEFLAGLRSLPLSEKEAACVAAVLKEKSPTALDAWQRTAVDPQPWAQQLQDRERRLATLQEEASIAKEKVKQLSQELQVEKQKTGRAEAVLRDQRGALEKELSVLQAKAQGSYQEAQGMQMKFQQLREQLEGQISRLQQENGILRDAVSTATNQMESKQSAELNSLRSEYAGLMQELAENNSKLQQEELQRKTLEVNYKQNVSQLEAQLQEGQRRWEELQGYLHSVNAEREQLQAAKQELQAQLVSAESEVTSKKQEIQTLHSSLTDTMVSREQLERRVLELLEESQHGRPEEAAQVQDLMNENKSLQVQVETLQAQITSQTTTLSHFEELQRLLAEKELQRKSLEDSLNAERSSGAGRESDMQAMHTDNLTLKAELQNLRDQMSEQTASQLVLDQLQKRVQEKDEKIRTAEELLESCLIKAADKEEELKKLREECSSLKQEVETLQRAEQPSMQSVVEELQRTVQEKEERLQAELESRSNRQKAVEALEQQVQALKAELEQARLREAKASASSAQLQELQALLAAREEEVRSLQRAMEEGAREAASREQQLQALQQEGSSLREQLEQRQVPSGAPSQELLTALAEKDERVSELQREVKELQGALEKHQRKNNELREKNWSAMEALSATESLLQGKLSRNAKESQKALESVEAECRKVLHRLLPAVPLPNSQKHQEWLQEFERAAKEAMAAETNAGSSAESEDTKMLEEKLKESEEAQVALLKDCETYKKVLAETEGILQRLQSSVEHEETRWRLKLEVSQEELREANLKVMELENEVDRLESVRLDGQCLVSELEMAKRESATYAVEVRELKAQLSEKVCRLEAEESQRHKVAGDLCRAQRSLDLIQVEIQNESSPVDLIENNSITTQRDETGSKKEKMAAGLHETVRELQHLLQALNKQLTEGQEGEGIKYLPDP
ncbi:kinectin-like isoform X2 [Megalops cyprinoides]|uniref:kinectin-like isoform X2 n=1 Tax=Megalops cyprinoides TaxID=118141 RepID=UPI001863DF99|nr:kinectin-like isoform X2 [Megalops cyprinoides]